MQLTFTKKFIGFFLVSILTLSIANTIAPQAVVFGNFVTTPLQAVLATGMIIAAIASVVEYVAEDFHIKLDPNTELVCYFLVNTAITYAIARSFVSKMIGFGIMRFWVAIILGIVLTAAHIAFARAMKKKW